MSDEESYLTKTFSFIIDDHSPSPSPSPSPSSSSQVQGPYLAGCSCPGANTPLVTDLLYLQTLGITHILSLNESVSIDTKQIEKNGFFHLHLPIPDYRPPTLSNERYPPLASTHLQRHQ